MKRKRHRRLRLTPEAAKGLLVIVILGICIYIGLATSVGTFVADKIIAPIFNRLEKTQEPKATATADPNAPSDAVAQTKPADSMGKQPEKPEQGLSLLPDETIPAAAPVPSESAKLDVKMPEREFYALQLGVFSTVENAKKESENVRARSAGGYILKDGQKYRVFAAVYPTQEQARLVKEQLKTQNQVDSGIFTITVPAVALRVTADETLAAAVWDGFSLLEKTCDEMLGLCQDYDRKNLDDEAAKQRLIKLSDALEKPANALSGAKEGMAKSLCTRLFESADRLRLCAEKQTGNTMDFSASLKYTHIELVCSYSEFIKTIRA